MGTCACTGKGICQWDWYIPLRKSRFQVDDVRSHLFEAETLLDKTKDRKDFTILFVWGFLTEM